MTMRRLAAVCAMGAIAWSGAAPSEAYLKLGARADGRTVTIRWSRMPVRYFVTDRGVSNVTAAALQGAVARAFATWAAVSSASVRAEFGGFTSARPLDEDGMPTIGFLDRPDLERVLGVTGFLVNTRTGELLEADIFLNAAMPWSVAPDGEAGRFDVESIAVHEVGHLLGLGHSAIGETELRPTGGRRVIATETAMFPIAFSAGNTAGRQLRSDDVAGISDIYPSGDFRRVTGSLSGRVTKGGRGVFGAHVVVYNLRTGKLVGGFTLDTNGDVVIAGLDAGPHVVRVEPLDDGDVESFFERSDGVDAEFRVTFASRLAVVPRGGDSGRVSIEVAAK